MSKGTRRFKKDPDIPTTIELVGKSFYDIKVEVVIWALKRYGSSYKASKKLNMSPSTMWRYVKYYESKHKIDTGG